MYDKAFHLEIVTPERVVFTGEATSLSAPGALGGFQILYDHAPFLSSLTPGEMKVKDVQGKDTTYAVSGGFVEVKANRVTVLAEAVEPPAEIDRARAMSSKARAEERLALRNAGIDEARARASLARALNRLRLVAKP
jgi:F-type H+-transporting ATPase subunit epsilon